MVSNRLLLLGLALALALCGCAALEREQAAGTERLLVAAGFHPDDGQDFAATPPREVVRHGRGARTFYTYADPQGCGCVYVGDAWAYTKYHELAVSEAIAADMAAMRDPAWGTEPWDWDDASPAGSQLRAP